MDAGAGPELESWKSNIAGTQHFVVHNETGAAMTMIVAGGKPLHISAADRRRNQENYANESLDPFKNGRMIPVRLDTTDPEAAALKNNPNILSEDDMRGLFKLPLDAFVTRLAGITLPATLERIVALADEVDGATVKQARAAQERLDKVSPKPFSDVTPVAGGGDTGVGPAIAAR